MSDAPNNLTLSGPNKDEGPNRVEQGSSLVSPNPIDETLGTEARIMLKSIRVPESGPLADDLKRQIRETVQAHVAKHKMVLREVGLAVGVGEGTVSEVIRGKYTRADDTDILRKLNLWLDDDERRRRRVQPVGFYETGPFLAIRALAQFAKTNARVPGSRNQHGGVTADPQRIVIGWGPAGCGKSLGAAALAAEDSTSILVRVEQRRGTDIGLAQLIIESAGWRGIKRDRRNAVTIVLERLADTGRLLIVDEAHRLKPSGCELIRDLADVCGIPILLLATQEFYERLTAVRTRAGSVFYDQFSRRVGYVCNLIRGVDGKGGSKRPIFSVDEVRAIFQADGVRVTDDAIDYLQAVSCTPGLGMLGLAAGLWEKAVRSALRKLRVIDARLLRQAAERSLIPAGELDTEVLIQIDKTLEVNATMKAKMAG
jgi:DNA transposition AAA+ family ATPase